MKSIEMPPTNLNERRDLLLEEAFLSATDGVVAVPNRLQQALFPRLSTQDSGLLLTTGPGAGRLEAAFVPILTGTRGDQLHRLFVIAPDSSLLDDYLYRIVPYVRGLAVARGASYTIFVEEEKPYCREYQPDGTFIDEACNHPLDSRVDIVVAHLSDFRALFFGAGGVHALPGKLERMDAAEQPLEVRRRDLFYFDEAQSYVTEEFRAFVRLVEFLYAEDLDVLIGSTTLPDACKEDLSFLEHLVVDDALFQPGRLITSVPVSGQGENSEMMRLVRERYFESSRAGIVRERVEDVDEIFAELSPLYPQLVFCYHSGQPFDQRMTTYASIRELEKEGEGYLLICDGAALENADFDINMLITAICPPEQLIRRAGRCNRRGDLAHGDIVVVGDSYRGRTLPPVRALAYVDAIKSCASPTTFDAEFWKGYIV